MLSPAQLPAPTNLMSNSPNSSTEDRALTLLGSGVSPEQAALALGISVSRISQLLSTEEFARQVAELRFQNLQKHNEIDASYDSIEETLIAKMKELLPMMYRPMEILKAISVINAAKRRGQSAPAALHAQQTVITLNMPTQIIQKFTTNIHNQVIQAGSQELLTIQSGNLLKKAEVHHASLPKLQQPAEVSAP
jgi:hypothetical protein